MNRRRKCSLVMMLLLVTSIIGSTITSSYMVAASQNPVQESETGETAVCQSAEVITEAIPKEMPVEILQETQAETQPETQAEIQPETQVEPQSKDTEAVSEVETEKVTEEMLETSQQITVEECVPQETEMGDGNFLTEGESGIETELIEAISEELLPAAPEETDMIRLYGDRPSSMIGETFTIFADVQIADTVSYQWQIQQEGTAWADIEGMTETQYTLLTEENSYTSKYRLLVTDTQGKQYMSKTFGLVRGVSEEVEETDLIQITSSPQAILAGFPFSMTADTRISETESFQWQLQQEGTEWSDIEGATETVYEFMAEESSYLNSYRFVVTDTQGKQYASFPFKPEKAVCYVLPETRDASVSTYSDLEKALKNDGTILLTENITISNTLSVEPLLGTRNVTIKSDMNQPGAPFRLIRNTTGNMFSIASSILSGKVSLTFADVILDGNNLNAPDDCLLYVRPRGTLTLDSGAVVEKTMGSGAIYVEHASSMLDPGGHMIMNSGSVIRKCTAQNGGAIYISGNGLTGNPGNLIVNGGTFSENTAANNGGAICGEAKTQIAVSNAVFQNNSAAKAGGAVFLSGTSEQTTFVSCNFSGNNTIGTDASDSYFNQGGGAVAIMANRHASFTDCRFTNNQSATSGGALLTAGTGSDRDKLGNTHVILSGCSFAGNQASSGGGGLATFKVATVSMDNTSILNNSAASGGAIYSGEINGDFGQVTINSGMISGNAATDGAGIYTGANNALAGPEPPVGNGYMSALKLGAGAISIQDEVYIPMSNAHIEVIGTNHLKLPRGEQIPVRIGSLPTGKKEPNEIGPGGYGAVVVVYPGYNTAEDSLGREELLKFRYTLPGYGFLMGRDVLELSNSPNISNPTMWSNSIRVVWEDSVQQQVKPITDLYVHSQYGVDPSEQIVSRALNLKEHGTETRPLQSIYMAYCIANEYNTADEITIHLMDTQSLGEYGVPLSMQLGCSSYQDESHSVTLTGANRKIQFVRHKASVEIPEFTGRGEQQYKNTNNQNALFKLDGTENLILDSVTVDGKNLAISGSNTPAALIGLHGKGAALTVKGGAVLQNNQDRAIYAEQGSVLLDGVVISGNTSFDGEGNGIWQGSNSSLKIRGALSMNKGQEIWLNAENPAENGGAKITVAGEFTLADLKKLSVDFPNYVNRRVVAVYDETLAAPDDAQMQKYQVDEAKLNAAALEVAYEGQEILLIRHQPFTFYKYGISADGQEKQPLKGVKFWLYSLDCTQEHVHDTYIDFKKKGGCFRRIGEAVSEVSGLVDFGYPGKGVYLLVEAETDYHYENPLNQWRIEINPGALHEEDAVKITDVTVGTEKLVAFVLEKRAEKVVWTLTNKRKKGIDFSLTKRDSESCDCLSGVGFTLYYCPYSWMPGHIHAEVPSEAGAFNGACWRAVQDTSTKNNGLADFGQIPDGDYLLKEAYTKENYYLPDGCWKIAVDSSNTETPIRITAKGAQQPEIKKEIDGRYTLRNHRRTDGMEFSFTKQDAAGSPLNNASFSLWKLRCNNPAHIDIRKHTYSDLYSEFIGGSEKECWEPVSLRIDGQKKKLFTSGEKDGLGVVTGAVDMGFLKNGTYCLMEDVMPAGYGDNADSGQWIWGIEINSEASELSQKVVITSLESAYGIVSPEFQVQVNQDGTGTVPEQTKVLNKKESGMPFSFYKLDAETDAPMQGVCFDLYLCLNNDFAVNSHAEHSEFVTQESVSSGNCWRKVGSAVSDSGGKVDFGEILYSAGSFRLVESRTLDGYKLPKTQWNISVPNSSTLAITSVTPIGETALEFTKDKTGNYVLKNKKIKAYPIEFMKVDGEMDRQGDGKNSPLAGASFQLYVCKNDRVGHVHNECASEESIKNGCWKPLEEDGKIKVYTSGADGMIHMKLLEGDYMLVETETPFGYHLPKGQILLRVTGGKTNSGMEFIAKGEDAPKYWYEETYYTGIVMPKIANEKEPGSTISFSKTDAEDINHFLTGAEFKIYTCRNKDSNHVHEELASAESIGKGCWEPIQEKGQDKVFTSEGEYGIVNIGMLPCGEYMLVETTAPEGYQLPDGQWHIVLESGKYWASNVTIKGNAPKIESNTQMGTGIIQPCIPNKKESKVSISFSKTDAEDINHFLTGAEFKIYTCRNKDSNHVHEELASAESIGKGCWEPIQEKGQDKVFTSEGEYGIVNIGMLPCGEYMLVETTAPEGYQLPDGQWHIVLESGKYWASNVTIKGNAPKIESNTQMGTGIIQPCIPNKKKVSVILPDTGGNGTNALYLIGLALMAGSGISFCFRRKRKA